MARRRKRGSLRPRASQSLRKLLKQLPKEDLIKLAMSSGVKGRKPRRRKGKKSGSYARTAPRDRLGRILPRGSRRVRRGGKRRAASKPRARKQVRRARKSNRRYISPAAAAARIRARQISPARTVAVVTKPRTVMTASQFKALQFRHNMSKARRRVHA